MGAEEEFVKMLEGEHKGQYSLDLLYSVLHKKRVLFLFDEVNNETSNSLIVQLMTLELINKGEPIWLFINSPGGYIQDGFTIIDVIKLMKSPVYTVGVGLVASMSAAIFGCGERGHRYAMPYSRYLLHQPSGGIEGQVIDVSNQAKELEKIRDIFFKLLSDQTGRTVQKISKDCDRDFILDPKEAIKYGLADRVMDQLPL